METLLIHNIGLLATHRGSAPLHGAAMAEPMLLQDASILVENGRVTAVCEGDSPAQAPSGARRYDAGGRLVTPGMIDSHTHLVFGGYRQQEVARRVRGVDYMEILRAGGGILDTVRHTRAASFDALYEKSLAFVWEMLARGVTACECKSGYGLDIETEMKQLRVARRLAETTPMDVRTTFLGAHAVPPEYAGHTDDYVDFLVGEAIPAIAAEGLADFCDVFCEEGVFSIAQSRRILLSAKEHSMPAKLHADEIVSLGGGALAAEVGAVSADHLIAVDPDGMRALAGSDTIATLLPQTSLYLGKPFAPGRALIEAGAAVALATDFNPGSCPSNNLQLSMNLGFLKYGLSPEEVLAAVTLNAACALGMGAGIGTLEEGKRADIVLWDAEDLSLPCYRMGSNLVHAVFKDGVLIHESGRAGSC
ncbi:imidazolonepropionase [Eubacteriales bacterium OttesenSCG-928-A19]|nr:imidazolonepropionase [Eubacteriales bacterium OttesenSCG-928-A19]